MDERTKSSSASSSDAFTEAEYTADVAKVIAHARETGRAVVRGNDGQPRVIITIPTEDLPLLGD